MAPDPLPPPWAKPSGHEPGPGFTIVTVGGISLWPGPPVPPDAGEPS